MGEGPTNAFLEGLDSVIQPARSIARGFRNTACFRMMILPGLGRLGFPAWGCRHALPTRNVEEPFFVPHARKGTPVCKLRP
ncbi:transposase [Olsenella sp. Marseille-P4559]|uniref:transposase n=1 Tax=Olsenella sp. Marseille-P4559 TaxID=2364795 RepID=UPI0013EEEDC7